MQNGKVRMKKKQLLILFVVVVILAIIIPIMLHTTPELIDLYHKGGRPAVEKYLRSFGGKGIVVIIVLQVLQVLSLVIPAPTIWIPAGVTYGIFQGMLICMVGVVIGNAIAFHIGRRYGNSLINVIFDEKKLERLNFLETSKYSSVILFLLFVIPGLPNNLIPYIYARAGMSLKKFLSIIAVSSIPSILSCTFAGHSILIGNIMIILLMAILLLIILFAMPKDETKLVEWLKRLSGNDKNA